MMPKDFVFNQIYHGAIKKGAIECFAHQKAVQGVNVFLKNAFQGKVGNYIESQIKDAVKLSKMAQTNKGKSR